MKALAWYVDLKDIENKNNVIYPYHTGIEKVKSSLQMPEWYPKMRYKINHIHSIFQLIVVIIVKSFARFKCQQMQGILIMLNP